MDKRRALYGSTDTQTCAHIDLNHNRVFISFLRSLDKTMKVSHKFMVPEYILSSAPKFCWIANGSDDDGPAYHSMYPVSVFPSRSLSFSLSLTHFLCHSFFREWSCTHYNTVEVTSFFLSLYFSYLFRLRFDLCVNKRARERAPLPNAFKVIRYHTSLDTIKLLW